MIKAIHADSFFTPSVPPCVPSDAGSPDVNSLVDRIRALSAEDYPVAAIKEILLSQNSCIDAGDAALEAIESIDSNTAFVICGQQAGLFGGPLYTLYKAMHAVRLSSVLSELSGKRIVPLFWIASDDHDFEEVASLGIRTNDGSVLRLSYTPKYYQEGAPVGDIVIDDGISDAIDMLEDHIGPGDFSAHYMSIIKSSWQPGVKWADAFAKQISALFREHGLVIFDPRGDGAKTLFREIMTAELNDPAASSSMVNAEADKYKTSKERKRAIRKPEDSTNLFYESGGVRHGLFFANGRFSAGNEVFSKDEMLGIIASAPERFSPGAALRPVCQDFVFPAAALISGPGERFYLKQIEPVYSHFNVSRSIPWPRASFTLIDQKTVRISDKEQIPLEKMFQDPDSIRAEHARNTFPPNMKNNLDKLEQTIDDDLNTIADQVGTIDPTLIKSIQKEKGKILHTINGIRTRAVRAHKSKTELSENRYVSSSYFLAPDGGPQERWFGIDAVISLFRDRGFDELLELTSPDEGSHRIIVPDNT
jgi:bacillithiol synthase